MKKINIYFAFFCISLMFTSCLVDDEAASDINDQGPNLAGFVKSSQNLSAVTDGNQFTFNVPMELKGPTLMDMTEDVTATISIDPSSTAVEGVHYIPFNTTVSLTKSNNYIAQLQVTVITEGIEAPLSVNPFLKLQVSDASGSNVINNGNPIILSFIYQCFADLSGTYLVTNDGCNMTPFLTTITANPDGSWFVTIGDGGFLGFGCTGNGGLENWANITELCGEILPSDDLQFVPCCNVGNIIGGTWDADNGILIMHHTQTFTPNWAGSWTSTYTKQ